VDTVRTTPRFRTQRWTAEACSVQVRSRPDTRPAATVQPSGRHRQVAAAPNAPRTPWQYRQAAAAVHYRSRAGGHGWLVTGDRGLLALLRAAAVSAVDRGRPVSTGRHSTLYRGHCRGVRCREHLLGFRARSPQPADNDGSDARAVDAAGGHRQPQVPAARTPATAAASCSPYGNARLDGRQHHRPPPPPMSDQERGRKVRQPPKAARTAGPPKARTRRSINRVKRTTRRGRTTPPRSHEPDGAWVQLLLQVVANYTRLSGVLAAGRAGHERASGRRYPGLSFGVFRRGEPSAATADKCGHRDRGGAPVNCAPRRGCAAVPLGEGALPCV
jgi:hypothetical protein